MNERTHAMALRSGAISAITGFISRQAAIVLAVITVATGLLAWEWHHAHKLRARTTPAAAHYQTGRASPSAP